MILSRWRSDKGEAIGRHATLHTIRVKHTHTHTHIFLMSTRDRPIVINEMGPTQPHVNDLCDGAYTWVSQFHDCDVMMKTIRPTTHTHTSLLCAEETLNIIPCACVSMRDGGLEHDIRWDLVWISHLLCRLEDHNIT